MRTRLLLSPLLTAMLISTALPGHAASAQDAQPGASFLKMSEGQRYWWIHGAIMTTSHLISTYDKTKGECASKWYLSDKTAKQKQIEETLAKNPSHNPTTVILGLLTQACGKLTPPTR